MPILNVDARNCIHSLRSLQVGRSISRLALVSTQHTHTHKHTVDLQRRRKQKKLIILLLQQQKKDRPHAKSAL